MIRLKVLAAFAMLLLVGYVFAEKRVKPIPLERLTDPASSSYVPIPFPKNEREAIIDLKYAIKKNFPPESIVYETYIGSSLPPIPYQSVLLNLLEEKPTYRIGEIIKVKNRDPKHAFNYTWLFIILSDDYTVATRVALEASGLLHSAQPNPPERVHQYLKTEMEVFEKLSCDLGVKLTGKDVKNVDWVSLRPNMGTYLLPTWEITLKGGEVYYYCEVHDECYKIQKEIPWKKAVKGFRPNWRKFVIRKERIAFDQVGDNILVFEKVRKGE